MSNYTKTTDFAAKDTLPGGDTNKVVRGAEFETEFDAISTAIATKSDTAGPTFTGTVTIPTVDINAGAIDGTVIGASSAAAGTFTNLTASGTVNFNGATISNLGTITTANLDGGTIDNAVIGGSTAAAGSFTTVAASSSITVGGAAVLTTVTFSNLDAGAVTTSGETFTDSDTQIPTNAAVKGHVEAVIPTLTVTEASVTQHQAALALSTSQITSGTFADARVAQSNVTQHQAALAITQSQITGGVSPTFTATASGTLANGDTVIVNSNGTVSKVAESVNLTPVAQSAVTFESASVIYVAAAFDSNSNKTVICYSDIGNSSFLTAVVGTISGTTVSFGTPVVIESGEMTHVAVAFDSTNNKVVVAYTDFPGNNRGRARVLTVSGTSISAGSEATFNGSSDTFETSMAFDSNAGKVVIAYKGASDQGKAVVGTVSGTSITFGSEATFNAATTNDISICFDPDNNKVVIAYQDAGNSSHGTAIVGTISGTSISFGSEVVFEAADTRVPSIVYDTSNDKVVISYVDAGDSNKGTAIVGTVSGTSVSFGSPVVFDASTLNNQTMSSAFDSSANKIVIAFEDEDNSNHGTATVGTVSGTSISFTTPIVYLAENVSFTTAVFDSNANQSLLSNGVSGAGKAVVFSATSTTTNLTAENYIGISNAAYSDGATATIQVVGAVDDAQSSLTPGQSYFVQNNGSLGLTAGDPSVFAGTAVAATKLIVKG